MVSSKIAAINVAAACIFVAATALGLHQPTGGEGGPPAGGPPTPYSNWYGANVHHYSHENYNHPDNMVR